MSIGRVPSTLLMSAIMLCIGPMLAIPRTAATTYEMGLAPLVSGFSPVLFSALFFLAILALCLKESAVVDIVGKILTPALLVGLLVLIVVGVVNPIGPVPDRVLVENVPVTGIEAGYQTMDMEELKELDGLEDEGIVEETELQARWKLLGNHKTVSQAITLYFMVQPQYIQSQTE